MLNSELEDVSIIARPADARITIDSIFHADGFFRSKLKRGSTHIIEVSKEGYRTSRIQTGNNVSAWFFANLWAPWSILGMPVDILTGSAFTIKPNPIIVELSPGSGPPIIEKNYLDGYAQAIAPVAILIGLEVWFIYSLTKGYH